MKKTLCNNRAEGHVDIGVKIVIAVVIGALLLGGLYLLFSTVILPRMNSEVEGMMDYTQELRYERTYDEASGVYTLRYSYDGKHWNTPTMPDYGESATVYGIMSNQSDTDPIEAALIQNGRNYYVITSTDGGVTWTEQVTFTANSITHCYFGTSSQLPREAGSFSGEKFVVRWNASGSTYYTMVSNGKAWAQPTWSDMHFV